MTKKKSNLRYAWDILRKLIFRGCLNPKKISLIYQVWPYTMVGADRLLNVYDLVSKIIREGVLGDIVECGVWKGGCAALMIYRSQELKSQRAIWLYDSFEGLPKPTLEDGEKAIIYSSPDKEDACEKSGLISIGKCVGNIEDVTQIFSKLSIDWKNVHIIKGWFQETLVQKSNQPEKISLLRLDGDWYESTKVCLENLYDKVSLGGYIILDDYFVWEGCQKAVNEFLNKRNIQITLHRIDSAGAYFVKN